MNYKFKSVRVISKILLWAALLQLVVLIAINKLPHQPTFPYAREVLPKYGSRQLHTWAHFDGVHYLTIVEKGYKGTGLIQAFFPLYPLLITRLSLDVLNPIVVGVGISLLSLVIGMIYLLKLIEMDESPQISRRVFWLMILFPVSFFFGAFYTESLFFMLSVLTFYTARKKKWMMVGMLGALTSLTRLVGVFLVPALLYELSIQSNKKIEKLWRRKEFFYCLMPMLGLLGYMLYLHVTFGDPLLFYSVQNDFGAQRETGRIILLYQVIWRYLKMLATMNLASVLGYRVILEFLSGVLGTILVAMSFFKTRKSYALYAALAFLLPTLTGTFSSMPRYLLPLFPLFVVLTKVLTKTQYRILIAIFAILLVVNLMLFTQGTFIS